MPLSLSEYLFVLKVNVDCEHSFAVESIAKLEELQALLDEHRVEPVVHDHASTLSSSAAGCITEEYIGYLDALDPLVGLLLVLCTGWNEDVHALLLQYQGVLQNGFLFVA